MPADWEDEYQEHQKLYNNDVNRKSNGVTLRPPLYNAEDYIAALKLLFSSHCQPPASNQKSSPVQLEHPGRLDLSNTPSPKHRRSERESPLTPPEMSMRKFLNGSELLFKLEADLRHAYPSFVQEFISASCEGVLHTLEALKLIQIALDEVNGLREQRKLFMDEQKCLQCLNLCLRNIEAVSKLSTYPGGLYPIAAAMVSTVTGTRIQALEILTCICSEGGGEGHFKVSEAISTLRLRLGEPIRCKLLIGAISSAPPGTFQAKGIRFLTAWVASAVSPRHKVHIQCELEEAGFNPPSLRKGAELGGARESREVQAELDAWERAAIDVDTLTRQNGQLRNSVATLQQELATLKDKLKRMDIHPAPKTDDLRRRSSRPKRSEETPEVTTPADSEEEAEQIHQILEDLNNIVNSELNFDRKTQNHQETETDIVPIHLVKSPPKKGVNVNNVNGAGGGPVMVKTRPWPSSGSDDEDGDDSDLVQTPSPKMSPKEDKNGGSGGLKNVRKVVAEIEKTNPKIYAKNGSSGATKKANPIDYQLLNFHKQNHIASKFANFKSSKLYSSSPDAMLSIQEPITANHQRFSPDLSAAGVKKGGGLRRSESLHTSLASIPASASSSKNSGAAKKKSAVDKGQVAKKGGGDRGMKMDKWKSVDDLDMGDNFTLRWRYPDAELLKVEGKIRADGAKVKGKGKDAKKVGRQEAASGRVLELFHDYRQSRFSKNANKPISVTSGSRGSGSPVSSTSIFSKYSKKSSSQSVPGGKGQIPESQIMSSEKESNLKMFSLPPIFVSQGVELMNQRICDLPSGLY